MRWPTTDETQLTEADIAALCTAGAMAPSGGNAQPWRVTVRGNRLRVGVDPRRDGESLLDVGRYAALLAVGCFAENVAIAGAARGLRLRRALVDDAGAAAVEFTVAGRQATPEVGGLAPYVALRVTDRRRYPGSSPPDGALAELANAVTEVDGGCRLVAVDATERKRALVGALGRADALRIRHPRLFAEMLDELRWSAPEAQRTGDGIDLRSLELPASTRRMLRVLRRAPRLRMLVPPRAYHGLARDLVAASSHVCCLAAPSPVTGQTMVRAGAALQRLWLTATRLGVPLQPWTVSTLLAMRAELADGPAPAGAGSAALRAAGSGFAARDHAEAARIGRELRAAFGLADGETPVVVFRLSGGPVRAPRLPWESFTTVERLARAAS